MAEGIFKNVELNDEELFVSKIVQGFYFKICRLDDSEKLVLYLIIKRKDKKTLEIEFDELLPGWIVSKVNLNMEDVIDSIYYENCKEGIFESILEKSITEFENMLNLQIGLDYNGVYFSVRFQKQKVSIWDRLLSEESVEDFIEVRHDEPVNFNLC